MYDRRREIDEAIAAGKEALEALEDAADSLDSAKRWGIVDILGGGLIKLDQALAPGRRQPRARRRPRGPRALLGGVDDVRGVAGLTAEVNRWNAFFDIACANWLADIFVQREMSDAADRVDEAIETVKRAVRRLEDARRA